MKPSRRLVFIATGVAATLFGFLLLTVPSLATLEAVVLVLQTVDAFGTERTFLVAGLCLVGYLGLALRTPTDSTDGSAVENRFERRIEHPPESVTVHDDRLAGRGIDQDIDAAISEGGDELRVLREQLRSLAITIYGDSMNAPKSVARDAVEAGDWCQDSTAATFLAADPDPPFRVKLRLLVFPTRERRRRIDRTIAAIETVERNT